VKSLKQQNQETQGAQQAQTMPSPFRKKLNRLWRDDRSYRARLVIALITLFAACFTFLFFGPMELSAYAQSSLVFSMKEALPIMAILTLVICVGGALVLALLHGRIFNYLITAVFSLLVCGYVQGNFLNGSLGALTGDTIKWDLQKKAMAGDVLVWLLIFLIPFIILYFNKNIWKKVIVFGSAALIVMQSVAFVTLFTSGVASTSSNKTNYLTQKEEGDYSTKHNTLIFLLDRMDYDHIEEIQRNEPALFTKLDGFTSYTNAISEHARTKPAINYLFTNSDLIWKVPQEEYFEKSWSDGGKNLLKDVKSQGYTIDFYTDIDLIFGNGSTVKPYISNMSSNKSKLNAKSIIKNLSFLSAYRYLPTIGKPFFWSDTDAVNRGIYYDNVRYQIDETQYDHIRNFTLNKNTKYLKYYHFMGSHPPYTVNEEGTRTGTTNVLEQTKGNFRILFRAFDKMKKMGIYKDSTILICADHGDPVNDVTPLHKANRIGFFYKPSGSAGTKLKESRAPISFKNVPASIAKSAGIADYHKYGKPIEEVGENDKVTRYFYKAVMQDNYEKNLYIYQINGDAADFRNWKIIRVDHPSREASFW
jgi:uncharacterized membrane protein YjjP (DUF1212 family)